MVVLEFAKSNRATCRTCNHNIDQGLLKIGTAVGNDGYINVEWHHDYCFWDKRVGKYYRRKNKKINIVVKIAQFSNLDILTPEQRRDLDNKLREANLKHATKQALEKAGIVEEAAPAVPHRPSVQADEEDDDDDEEDDEGTEVAEKKKVTTAKPKATRGRKPKQNEVVVESETANKPIIITTVTTATTAAATRGRKRTITDGAIPVAAITPELEVRAEDQPNKPAVTTRAKRAKKN